MFLPREHPPTSCAPLGSSFPCCCCFRLNFYEVVFPHFTSASLFFIRSSLPGEAARSRVPAVLRNTLSSVKTWVVFEKHCNRRKKKKVQHYKENLLCFYDGDRCWAWGLMPGKSGHKQSDKDRMCFFSPSVVGIVPDFKVDMMASLLLVLKLRRYTDIPGNISWCSYTEKNM